MKFFVSGGAGFLGSAVTRSLLQSGHTVLVYDDLSCGCQPPSPHTGLTFVRGDIVNTELLERTLHEFQPEGVIHLAALHFIPACNARPQHTLRINVEGTQAVMLACLRTISVRGVVFASSGAVYGPDDRWHVEDEPFEPTDVYGLSKVLGEQVVRHYTAEGNFGAASLRFANLYGPGETNPHVIPEIVRQVRPGSTLELGRIDTYRDFLYIEDAARCVLAALNLVIREQTYQVFNAASGIEYSIREILQEIEEIVGYPLPVQTAPARVRRVERNHLRLDRTRLTETLQIGAGVPLQEGLRQTLQAAGVPVDAVALATSEEAG
ncbi:NAD-dependent epimerase/dehydratase family protein [Terriglobus albidus]|uniref:NAD-dependent epimerase/dehydratase family protein n=1 Tax=Terriglobus albidus TaxID=1592106 RepID=UPI0021E0B134|nr:NAD-dependent epimerase/dehydratase family protein [Terriglobus albidus]